MKGGVAISAVFSLIVGDGLGGVASFSEVVDGIASDLGVGGMRFKWWREVLELEKKDD